MTIAKHEMRQGDRYYPCHMCPKEHPSTTSLLDVVGSKVLGKWEGKLGTKKLLLYEEAMEDVLGEKMVEMRSHMQKRWEALGETTDFWKNGGQVAKEAAEEGSQAHAAFEMFLAGKEVDEKSLPPGAAKAFSSFRRFHSENEIKTIQTEKTFYNCSLGYAGTADWLGHFNGKLTLADWKTSSGIYEKNVVQCWANAIADEMMNGANLYQQILVGRFGKDGSREILIIPRHGLDGGYGGYEEARELIKACVPWFKYKKGWASRFPYRKK